MDVKEGLIIEDITENTDGNKMEVLKEIQSKNIEDSTEKKIEHDSEKENVEKNSLEKIREQKENSGLPRLTKEVLKKHCKDKKLYITPYLNDTLYLHYMGIGKIENLEEYTGLRSLWLESNGIKRIENLDKQTELRCLFLHQNLISKIENVDHLIHLDTLNLSNNFIKKIENLRNLPALKTLNITHNNIQTAEDIEELMHCEQLSCIDMAHNKIDDPEIVNVFGSMKSLRVLILRGNPVLRDISNCRKTLILKIADLQHLDDRPVFPKERACTEAWAAGGREAEKAERERWNQEERDRIMRSVNALRPRNWDKDETSNIDTETDTQAEEQQEESTKLQIIDVTETEEPVEKKETNSVAKSAAVDSKKVFDILKKENKVQEEKEVDIPFITTQKSKQTNSIFSTEVPESDSSDNFLMKESNDISGDRLFYKRDTTKKTQGILIEDITNDDDCPPLETVTFDEELNNGNLQFVPPNPVHVESDGIRSYVDQSVDEKILNDSTQYSRQNAKTREIREMEKESANLTKEDKIRQLAERGGSTNSKK
ncbi:DgyrCDS367 [Dimorphilus gyrociliatus]|uniref:DgyrCDS367 n=1 Tax=Dimorphilus gyrociliatus TaxID=2664684 RepID=A0A7I8V4I5_9ANNE|nr:DgyrCDS367 [Dimorphilus gyrociliatus]